MISLVVKLPIKEGMVDEFIELFKELMDLVAKEEGNLLYSISKNPAEPNTVVIMERYKDEEALAAHGASDYFKEYNRKFGPFVAGKPEMMKMEEVYAV
ncbi:MAG: antibiotic biosynthesis monooxygenase [Deltaproteobacteria bacterium]|nr:antibiotic biosynthesis monooxygenase [Deltaproteobacteria bacterium]MBW2051925.1 antibiotic biosynthesis monooxygenase [Deltaproteobacteria bacterium]MBW2140332.1 antibiotic biosynthesis monooxygenase [Deltaproteobacteria bacterium]MBW2324139.1 antibiotic biosynthesis monooxygenase [Deltaproteobacteria bacterium]